MLEVQAGSDFTVELQSPSGTGYRWEVERTPPGIAVVGRGASSATDSAPRPGSPVTYRFTLHADPKAQTGAAIVFALKRPWEAESARTHTVSLALMVGPAN
ncbi:protease inhibitor I42 family protein [Sinomonas sp. JGH33]|uniref:Protease inhibitor I42 family protein n=1 Tax=Sinomonas terricola TaxID=3110330 RepID=A0ABU5T4V5_9MICC|nr:protease inhibitor I42 family protein [Sinomonas sp. JGH33]MEA5454628.1 protease inhibitor I42 family protein [Sinomonas sp. JGH33]